MSRSGVVWALFLVGIFPLFVRANDRAVLVADESSQAIQNDRADDDNLSRMADLAMLRDFVRHGYLVPVPTSTSGYYLNEIPSEYRYARPWAKQFLTRIGRQFNARFGHRLRVTSMVRTEERQLRIADWNANAADATGPMRSSHLTGATVDISKRFMSTAERRWMRDVLYSLRESGYLYAIEEFGQPVFHVMVFRDYSERHNSKMTRSHRSPPKLRAVSLPEVADDASTEQ